MRIVRKLLPRGLPGMTEVPALKELNDIREYTGHDLSVLDQDTFIDVADLLTQYKYGLKDLNDAYLQLHLIADAGGSVAPQFAFTASKAKQGKNVGKYDIKRIAEPDQERVDRDNMRSRELTALSMLENHALTPVKTNSSFLSDTEKALNRFVTSNSIATKLANSGVRVKKGKNDPQHMVLAVQNWNDLSGGYDRASGDYIATQPVEFGHYVPHELGGVDAASNGRMQAMASNRATGARQGIEGAMSALGGTYENLKKRFAGDRLTQFIYNNGNEVIVA